MLLFCFDNINIGSLFHNQASTTQHEWPHYDTSVQWKKRWHRRKSHEAQHYIHFICIFLSWRKFFQSQIRKSDQTQSHNRNCLASSLFLHDPCEHGSHKIHNNNNSNNHHNNNTLCDLKIAKHWQFPHLHNWYKMQPDIIERDRHLVWSPINKTMSFSYSSTSSSSIERCHL